MRVDNHDAAYQWACQNKVAIHPDTKVIQIYETQHISAETDTKPADKDLFSAWRDRQLCRLGVPKDLIALVRTFATKSDLEDHMDDLPEDAALVLSELADGADYDSLVREIDVMARQVAGDDYSDALKHPKGQPAFVIIRDDASLREMIDAPLGEWRIFLHPAQRSLVNMNARGPMRVLGGAGTGKTVVAMHRAKRLATEVFNGPEDRILFLVFSKNLVADVRANLKKMCSAEAFGVLKSSTLMPGSTERASGWICTGVWPTEKLRKTHTGRKLLTVRTLSSPIR